MSFDLYKVSGDANSRVLGFRAPQNRMAVAYLSAMIDEEQPTNIVEIGTNGGGLTACLGLHAMMIGAKFWTFDTKLPELEYAPFLRMFNVRCVNDDVFTASGLLTVRGIIQAPGKCIVLCDGANKMREVRELSRFLKAGDIIGAHDYYVDHKYWAWSEVDANALKPVEAECGLIPYHQDDFDKAGWLMRKKA